MLRDHIRSALRVLRRHPAHAAVNIGGLAVALAATFAILIFIAHETSFDRHHQGADRIYRVAVERAQPDGAVRSAATPRPLAAALEEQLPEVERATRLSRERAEEVLVRRGTHASFEDRFFFADSSVFDVFSLPLVRGNPSTALVRPFSVVLTEETARRLFGSEDPIGQSLTVRLRGDGDLFEYHVTAVARDLPATSHFRFDFLASYEDHPNVGEPDDQSNWAGLHVYTYLKLDSGADVASVEEKIPGIVRPQLAAQIEENLGMSLEAYEAAGNRFDYFLQPLTDIHLHSRLQNEIAANGDARYVTVFGIIAALILGLACINFTHLAAARSISRMREVGVRKVLGARRSELIRQFLAESLLSAVAAGVIALVIVRVGASFATASGPLGLLWMEGTLTARPDLIALLAASVLMAGFAAGILPALYMSRFEPAAAVRGGAPLADAGPAALRAGLLVFQFAVSGALIACTLVMERQMDFLQQANLGFDHEHVVVIDGAEVVAGRMREFRRRVHSVEGVAAVTNAQSVPGRPLAEMTVRRVGAAQESLVTTAWMTAGGGYASTLGIELMAGRDLSADVSSDSTAVLLNESAARALGYAAEGGTLLAEGREYAVVGIVEDHHFSSMHEAIGPLVIFGPDPWNQARPNFVVAVRVARERLDRTLASLEGIWSAFVPGQPFAYTFLDDEFARQYDAERRTRALFRLFSALAVAIAALGLFGLTAFAAQRRTKEIGVRKVLGASVPSLVKTLGGRFAVLVAAGLAAAAPVAYIAMSRWLDEFAYRIELGPGSFLLAGVIVLIVAGAAVGFHVLRAAVANPVESLKCE